MSKSRPWACIITSIVTVIVAIVLLFTASVYTNRGAYLRNYWTLLYSLSIFSIIIAIFAIIFAIGLLYVVFRRFPALTTLFCGLLAFAALLSGICVVILLIARPNLRDNSFDNARRLLGNYSNSNLIRSTKSVMDKFQQMYHCCGVDRALDWAVQIPDGKSTPDSCCRTVRPNCGNNSLVLQNTINLNGCAEPIAAVYRQRYTALIGIHFTLIIFTLVSATLGLIFERYIREQYQLM